VADDLPDDVAGTCDALAATQADLIAVETRQLRLAAHWLDLHTPVDEPDTAAPGRTLPGCERWVRSGADGTPLISEFACAEFAALQDMHPLAGAARLRKVADLRHRHTQLWRRVLAGEVPAWKALETARLVGRTELGLTLEQARWIDEHSFEWITTLPWGAYVDLVERLIIDADPEAAETRRLEAETRQGVWTGQSSEHGLKTIIARAGAGEVLYLVAVVDRIAEILATKGDLREIGPRRASALATLAHPAHALSLLAEHVVAGPPLDERSEAEPTPEPEPADEGQSEPPMPEQAGDADVPSFLRLPDGLAETLTRLDKLGGAGLGRLLPPATLYVHVDRADFDGREGSAFVEGVGPITLDQAREWLGHRRVRVTEVVDLAARPDPVDGYAFPRQVREIAHLTNPRDVFPFGVNTGRGKDIDHPIPYRPPDEGGPPGQTGLHNAGPMTRFHHRIKTFGLWRVRQLGPSAHLWHSPHDHCWLVDPTGTHKVPSAAVPWILRDLGTQGATAATQGSVTTAA
jgi:hypothetical protein